MANQPKDIFTRVADLGEEALHKLPNFPGSDRVMEVVNQSRARIDEVQKRLRGLDALEKRVDELEKRVARLDKSETAKEPAASKPSTAKKPTTPKNPPA
jgi:uncharacterized protein involved in exopolysaccharide biosynthesis